jgi:hypothetical protein
MKRAYVDVSTLIALACLSAHSLPGCTPAREPSAGAATQSAARSTPPPALAVPTRPWPGEHGKSGVNADPSIDLPSLQAFCSWRGRPCDLVHVYTDRKDWETMTRAGWMFDAFAGYPGEVVISQGLVPERSAALAAADLAACAAGEHDEDFRAFGSLMVNKNRAASVVRLGWEFNGDFMPWAATDTQQWKRCYRHAALAIRATNPRVILDWTINSHGTPAGICGGNSLNCYPGDDLVDIIGIDNYDMAPSATSAADFTRIANAPEGMTWLLNFAKKRGKRFSVGEWGIAPGSEYNQTGENPQFIRWMHDWFATHSDQLAYEAYFNNCEPKLVESNLNTAVGPLCGRQNRAAGELYRKLFGRSGTPAPDVNAGRVPPTRATDREPAPSAAP